jgi:DNA repair and recombination protein RAD54B
MFVRSFDDLTRVNFDLVVCDEGHRLKNEKVKASTMLSQMDTQMRVVLTGTPLQNDLKEFYALVCVVNPNVFGTSSVFAKNYEEPIVKSKQPEASWEELEEGRMKAEQLSRLTAKFILRRTQDVISKFLPPKTELVVFCRPTPLQSYIYSKTLNGLQSVSSLDSTCVLAR